MAGSEQLAVCLGCGCLCDDIAIGPGEDLTHACAMGRDWFLDTMPPSEAATIDARPTSLEAALEQASVLLFRAKAPIITGLKSLTIEAQRGAVALADHLGGLIDSSDSADSARQAALARVGVVTASLGEVKSRADVVVFFGVEPSDTHPRHRERYSVDPQGRFLTRPRTVIVVDVTAETRLAVIATLRAMLRNGRLDVARVQAATGLGYEQLLGWVSTMSKASYGAFFYGSDLDAATIESLFLLVRELNDRARFVTIGLGGPGNSPGAEAVLTWQTGYPSAVDLASGVPRSLIGDTSVRHRLDRGEADCLLVLGEGDPPPTGNGLPMIVIGPRATSQMAASAVAIATGRPGIEVGGTVSRVDGVMLPLKPVKVSDLPGEAELLEVLLRKVQALGSNFPA